MRETRQTTATAGAAAVVAAFATGELLAGLIAGVPSPLDAVGQRVIPVVPGAVEQWAIATFGTSDKTALTIGTVLVGLLLGAAIGRARHPLVAPTAFIAFGVAGAVAMVLEPAASPVAVMMTVVAMVAAGLGTLRWLAGPAVAAAGARPWLQRRTPTDAPVGAGPSPTSPPVDRRRFLALAGGIAGVAVAAGATGRFAQRLRVDSGQRAAVMLPAPDRHLPRPGPQHGFEVDGLSPVLTANSDFYRIDTALAVPRVDLDGWRLRFTGLVERPFELAYDDLLALPLIERDVTLACVSNEVGGSLIGTARWLGVPLAELLDRAGVQPDGTQVVGRAVDGFTVGFPTEVARDGRDALVAIGMNGEPLPTRHGFPARLVVPGLYGYVSATKWLTEVELTTWDAFDAYWVPRGWSKEAPIKLQSRIDTPRDRDTVRVGDVTVAGVAWAPTRGIADVEVQVDERPWQPAELAAPLSDDTWVLWRAKVALDAGVHELRVRATDASGGRQPPGPRPPQPDGAEGWHTIRVHTE